MRANSAGTLSKDATPGADATLAKGLAKVLVNAVAPAAILWPESGMQGEAAEALIAKTPLARRSECEWRAGFEY